MAASGTATLYDPAFEHDSCGFGLVAQIDGHASAALVDTAFAALAKLSHRGGVNADGISGDGCGVLIHHPASWLRALAVEAGIAPAERFAAGLVFFDPAGGETAAIEFERHLAGRSAAGWLARGGDRPAGLRPARQRHLSARAPGIRECRGRHG